MGSYEFGAFNNAMFTIVPVIVCVVFIAVLGLVVARLAQGAARWKRNNESPVLTVGAKVVAKRQDVHIYRHANGNANGMAGASSSTDYYVTFEFVSGDRLELDVRDTEYGMLAEGDAGELTFQGTRYLGFTRGNDASV